MTTNDQAANQTVSPAKQEWVKPEITSFAAAVDAAGGATAVSADGAVPNQS